MDIKFKENLAELLEPKHMSVEEMMKELNIASLENLTLEELNKISILTDVSRGALVEDYFRTAMLKTEDDLIRYINDDRLDLIKEIYRNGYLFNRRNKVSLISFKELLRLDPILIDNRSISLDTFIKLGKYLLFKGEIKMLIDLSSEDYCLPPYTGVDMDTYIKYMVDSFDPNVTVFRQYFGTVLYDLLAEEDKIKFEDAFIELLKKNTDYILSCKFDGNIIRIDERHLTIRDTEDSGAKFIFYKENIYKKFSEDNRNIVANIYQDIEDSCGPIVSK